MWANLFGCCIFNLTSPPECVFSWFAQRNYRSTMFLLPHKKKSLESHWCSGLPWIAWVRFIMVLQTEKSHPWENLYFAPIYQSPAWGKQSDTLRPLLPWRPIILHICMSRDAFASHRTGNVLSDRVQAAAVLQMLFLLWLLEEMFC